MAQGGKHSECPHTQSIQKVSEKVQVTTAICNLENELNELVPVCPEVRSWENHRPEAQDPLWKAVPGDGAGMAQC